MSGLSAWWRENAPLQLCRVPVTPWDPSRRLRVLNFGTESRSSILLKTSERCHCVLAAPRHGVTPGQAELQPLQPQPRCTGPGPQTSSEIRYTRRSACILTQTAPFQRTMNHIQDPPSRQLWRLMGRGPPHRSTTVPGITDLLVVHFLWTCFVCVEGHGYFPCWIKAMQHSGVKLGLEWPTKSDRALGYVLWVNKDKSRTTSLARGLSMRS